MKKKIVSNFFFRKKYAIKKIHQNLLGIRLNYVYAMVINQTSLFHDFKQILIEIFYNSLDLKQAYYYFWLGFLVENIGEPIV